MGQFGKIKSIDDLPADAELDALIREAAELAEKRAGAAQDQARAEARAGDCIPISRPRSPRRRRPKPRSTASRRRRSATISNGSREAKQDATRAEAHRHRDRMAERRQAPALEVPKLLMPGRQRWYSKQLSVSVTSGGRGRTGSATSPSSAKPQLLVKSARRRIGDHRQRESLAAAPHGQRLRSKPRRSRAPQIEARQTARRARRRRRPQSPRHCPSSSATMHLTRWQSASAGSAIASGFAKQLVAVVGAARVEARRCNSSRASPCSSGRARPKRQARQRALT